MKNIAIVIGGSSGIGYAIVNKLKENYFVINMSRSKNNLSNNVYLDLEDYNSVISAFSTLFFNYGQPSIMVYSSGYVEPQSIMDIDQKTLIKTININLLGAFYCTQEFIKISDKKKNKKIIYLASTAGTRPQMGWSSYSSSKAGLINFALTMSEELKPYNTTTYCLSCGRCATPLRKILAPNEDYSKIMQPEEVGTLVMNLIKNDNVLNGQNIIVKKDVKD